jgi:hypothetical protein
MLCLLVAIAWNSQAHFQRDQYPHQVDFDVHYFGAVVERSGSYTETERVRELMLQHRSKAQPEGVVGTPALVGVVYMPLSHLDLDTAETIWMIIAVAGVTIGLLQATARRHWCYLPLAFCAFPLMLALWLGNVSAITFALIAFAYGSAKKGQFRLAGAAIGIAIAFKAFPAILLVPLVVHRNWRALRWSLGSAAAVTLAGVAALGPHDFLLGMERTVTFEPFDLRYEDNVSIPGVVHYYVGKVMFAKTMVALTFLLGLYAILRRPKWGVEFSLAATSMLMLLGNSLSWNHYFCLLPLGFIALLDLQPSLPIRIGAALVTACALSANGWSPSLTIGTVIVLGALVATLNQRARSAPELEAS